MDIVWAMFYVPLQAQEYSYSKGHSLSMAAGSGRVLWYHCRPKTYPKVQLQAGVMYSNMAAGPGHVLYTNAGPKPGLKYNYTLWSMF